MVKYNVYRSSPDSDKYATFIFKCECGSNDHDLYIEVEPENKGKTFDCYPPYTYLSFEKTFMWCDYFGVFDYGWKGFFKRMKRRIGVFCKLLFKGKFEIHEEMIIGGSEHIQSFIDVLEECKERVIKGEQKWMRENSSKSG